MSLSEECIGKRNSLVLLVLVLVKHVAPIVTIRLPAHWLWKSYLLCCFSYSTNSCNAAERTQSFASFDGASTRVRVRLQKLRSEPNGVVLVRRGWSSELASLTTVSISICQCTCWPTCTLSVTILQTAVWSETNSECLPFDSAWEEFFCRSSLDTLPFWPLIHIIHVHRLRFHSHGYQYWFWSETEFSLTRTPETDIMIFYERWLSLSLLNVYLLLRTRLLYVWSSRLSFDFQARFWYQNFYQYILSFGYSIPATKFVHSSYFFILSISFRWWLTQWRQSTISEVYFFKYEIIYTKIPIQCEIESIISIWSCLSNAIFVKSRLFTVSIYVFYWFIYWSYIHNWLFYYTWEGYRRPDDNLKL